MYTSIIIGVLLVACTGLAAAAPYTCGVSWEADGKVVYRGPVSGTAACQNSCERSDVCQVFTVYEDINNPASMTCSLMNTPVGTGKRNMDIIAICAKTNGIWQAMAVPTDFSSNTGTFVALKPGLSGAYSVAAYSLGLIGIHTTMVPNTNLLLSFGRPQSAEYPAQPNMANTATVPWSPWPASLVDPTTGRYQSIPSYAGAPFCAHTIHLSNDDILSCGGDDNYIRTDGGWGGAMGCRIFTTKGPPRWLKGPTMAAGHWYPTMIELPPGVGRSKGTCALVMGGTLGDGSKRTTHMEVVCPTENVVVSARVMDLTKDPALRDALTSWYPTSFLLPINSPPSRPTIIIHHANGGQVVQLELDVKNKRLRLKTVRKLPAVPDYFPQSKYPMPSAAVLLAVDLAMGVKQDQLEFVFFGGVSPSGTMASGSAFRLKPLAAAPEWEVEEMPSPALMRVMVLLPNGKMILVNGGREGVPGGSAKCCTSNAAQPIVQAWEYTPYEPKGRRFKVDTALNPHFRLYHGEAFLGVDGAVYITGGDQGIRPDYRPGFTMDRYIPSTLRVAISKGKRPVITWAPAAAAYGQTIALAWKRGKVSRVSLVKPAAVTHNSHPNERVLMLKTVSVGKGKIQVQMPASSYIAQQGWWLLYAWDGDVWSAGKWVKLG